MECSEAATSTAPEREVETGLGPDFRYFRTNSLSDQFIAAVVVEARSRLPAVLPGKVAKQDGSLWHAYRRKVGSYAASNPAMMGTTLNSKSIAHWKTTEHRLRHSVERLQLLIVKHFEGKYARRDSNP